MLNKIRIIYCISSMATTVIKVKVFFQSPLVTVCRMLKKKNNQYIYCMYVFNSLTVQFKIKYSTKCKLF